MKKIAVFVMMLLLVGMLGVASADSITVNDALCGMNLFSQLWESMPLTARVLRQAVAAIRSTPLTPPGLSLLRCRFFSPWWMLFKRVTSSRYLILATPLAKPPQ